MIYSKSLVTPKQTRRVLHLTVDGLTDGTRFPEFRLIGARKTNGVILPAESGTVTRTTGGNECSYLMARGGLYYIYGPRNLTFATNGPLFNYITEERVNRFLFFRKRNGEVKAVALQDDQLIYLDPDKGFLFDPDFGGTCGAIYNERFFIGKGKVLIFSDEDTPPTVLDLADSDAGGSVDFQDEDRGNIVDMVVFKDRLYLFREGGITSVYTSGAPIEYKIAEVPCKYNRLLRDTVADCGAFVYFFTESGLHSFDGRNVKKINEPASQQINLGAEIRATAHGGRYYCTCTDKNGAKFVYCYDPEEGCGHFFGRGVTGVSGGESLYFIRGTSIYKGTELGLFDGEPACYETGFFAPSDGNEFLFEAVTVEGEGTVQVRIRSDKPTLLLSGSAGVRQRVDLKIDRLALDIMGRTDFRLKGIKLEIREVKRNGH